MAIRSPEVLDARPRLQGYFVWDIVDFLINATLFALIGLQLHAIVAGLHEYRFAELVTYAAAVTVSLIAIRLVWFFTVPYLVRLIDRRPQQRRRRVGASWRLVTAWSGMRGAVSLAVALAVPTQTADGAPFPHRELILFLTFVIIFFTLVVQGLTLPALIGRLDRSTDRDAEEEARARLTAARAALEEIDVLAERDGTRPDTAERMRGLYEYRAQRFAARLSGDGDGDYEERSQAYQEMVRSVLAAQRRALMTMRREGALSNEAFNRILRDIDLEESRLET